MSVPQSLPSFAQAFSSSSLSDIAHISNALPPIQSRPSHSPPRAPTTKKRSRPDPSSAPARADRASVEAHNADAPRQSPRLIRIKEEDGDDAHQPPMSPPAHGDALGDGVPAPAVLPLSKKRRVTVGAIPPAEHGTPIPISPVLASFPAPDESLPRPVVPKHPQKTLVDQRRDGLAAAAGPSPGSLLSASPPGDQLATSKRARMGRVSPTAISVASRCAGNPVASTSQATSTSARPLTPPPPSQPPTAPTSAEPSSKLQPVAAAHSLPPPPISFARRRAAQPGGRKKKPADIVISPRGAGPSDPLAPVIQSAPPVADPGRFPMAIPRLPLVMNSAQSTRRVAGNVPPTPTRFGLHGTPAPSISSTARAAHSPPNPPVPITGTLVPPTPHALQHPGYSGDKSAFLAPFEVFYDALNDAKQLKGWLSDQLQKSNALMVSLKQQQDKMDETVEDLVEKRTRVMREEITMLRQRMESLEEALLAVRAESSAATGQDSVGHGYPQGGKHHHQNGAAPDSASSTHPFPAPEVRRPDAIIRVISSEGEREQQQPSVSPPVEVTRRPEGLHGPYGLGGHHRSTSGSQKGTPLVRSQSSTGRPGETRAASRLWSYGSSNPPGVEQTASRGDKS